MAALVLLDARAILAMEARMARRVGLAKVVAMPLRQLIALVLAQGGSAPGHDNEPYECTRRVHCSSQSCLGKHIMRPGWTMMCWVGFLVPAWNLSSIGQQKT